MGRNQPLTDAEKAAIRQFHADGLGRNQICEKLGRSPNAVSNFCNSESPPLTFDRARTRAGAEAVHDEADKLRAELELKFLKVAMESVELIGAEYLVFNFGGKDNTYEEHLLDKVPTQARLELVRAADTAMRASLRINEHESPGAKAATSLLASLASAMGIDDNLPTA